MTRLVLRLVTQAMSSRAGRLRAILVALAACVSALLLLAVATAPILTAHEQSRAEAQVPVSGQATRDVGIGYQEVDSHYHAALVKRVLVTQFGAAKPVPPGIAKLPRPGDMYASPYLASRMRVDATLATWFPFRLVGIISPSGIVGPHQLIAYVGVAANSLPKDDAAVSFGDASAPTASAVGGRWYQVAGFALLVIAPALVSFVAIARVGAENRRQRDRALHLLAVPRYAIGVLGTAEAGLPTIAGTAAAVGLFEVGKSSVHSLPVVHRSLNPADLTPGLPTILIVAFGLIGLAGLVGLTNALRSTNLRQGSRPLQAPAAAARSPLGLFVVGALGLGWAAARAQPRDPLFRYALILTALGLPLTSLYLGRIVARVARASWPLTALIGFRRVARSPGPIAGLVSVVTVLTFALTCAVPVVRTFNDSPSWRSLVGSSIVVRAEPLAIRVPFVPRSAPPARASVTLLALGVWGSSDPAGSAPEGRALIATCADLDALIGRHVSGCRADAVQRVSSTGTTPLDGVAEIRSQDQGTSVRLPPTTGSLDLSGTGSVPVDVSLVLTPGSAALVKESSPFVAAAYARIPSVSTDVEAFQAWTAEGSPSQILDVPGQESVSTSNTASWIVLAMLLCACLSLFAGFAVSITGRREEAHALTVLGVSRGMLRGVAAVSALIMGLVGATAAVGTGLLAVEAFTRVLRVPPPGPGPFVALWVSAVLASVLLAVAADLVPHTS